MYCMLEVDENYVIDLKSEPDQVFRLDLQIQVSRTDGHVVWTWLGHAYSVFLIDSDRLYYADYSTASSGGNVVAVDLKTGVQIWNHELYAMGGPEHSTYENLINMRLTKDGIVIYGNEAGGKYIEVVSQETGKLLHYHRVRDTENQSGKEGSATLPATQPAAPDEATLRKIAMDYLRDRRRTWISEVEKMPGKVSDAGDLWVYTFQGSGAEAGNLPEVYVDKATMKAVYPVY